MGRRDRAVRIGDGPLTLAAEPTPVSVEWAVEQGSFSTVDPDGVPTAADDVRREGPSSVRLDHVRLNCADLAASVDFYRALGLVLTWVGFGPKEETVVDDGDAALPDGADWVHLSAPDGYMSLSQADGLDYGVQTSASGPPRFIHVGFAVDALEPVLARLDDRHLPYRLVSSPLGRQVYLNDCDGEPHVGFNVELVEYAPAVSRSGRLD